MMRVKAMSVIQKVLEYCLVAAIILNCNSVYAASVKDLHLNELIAVLTLFLIATVFFMERVNKILLKKWARLFIPYYALTALFIIVSVPAKAVMGFVSRFILFVPLMTLYLLCLAKRGNQNRILTAFVNSTVVLSAISLFFWLFGSLLNFLQPNMSIHAFWGSEYDYPGYFGLYFERQTISLFTYSGYRNDGIFTEGPMFSLCIVISLAILLCTREYRNRLTPGAKLKAGILSTTLITVMSFSGYAMMVALFFARFVMMKTKNKDSLGYKYMAALFFSLIVGGVVFLLLTEKQQTSSWMIRQDDVRAGIKAWLAAPVFGNGYGTYSVKDYMSADRWWNTGFSSSLFAVLSQGGIALLLVYVTAFYCGFRSVINTREKMTAVFIMIIITEFVTTLFHYTFLMFLLLAYCYSLFLISSCYKQRQHPFPCRLKSPIMTVGKGI